MRSVRTALVLVAMALAACTGGAPPTKEPASRIELTVMEFNIEYGGDQVDFDGVPEAIRAAGADVVAIEEAYANVPRIAEALGWDHYDPRTQIVSRYPLLAPDNGGLFTYVQVDPGSVVAIANVHLPSTGYGPFKVRDGATQEEVLAIEENKRLPAVEPTLRALGRLVGMDVPVFLVGDFNAPSHLDWTEEAAGTRDDVRYALSWPVSEAVEREGLVDSYREVHPDPVLDPGLTWPANRPIVKGYNPYRNRAPADRIDFIYSGGPATPVDSLLVGEEGGPGVEIAITPWPTDHRAIVSTFDVAPAEPPVMVAVGRMLVAPGAVVQVLFHSPGDEGERLVVVPAGGDPRTDAAAERATGEGSPTDGAFAFPTEGLEPGPYEAALVDVSGGVLARTPFWVDAGTGPEIATTRRVYEVGETIRVRWRAAPGNRWDWVGIYGRGADPNVAYYELWAYTGATIEGSVALGRDANGPWPLRPGRYSVYLLLDDSYAKAAGGGFTVR
ncbi:MAG: endonuclease/exonuclease/phosphatase family protein [Actinomycetota bacterium]